MSMISHEMSWWDISVVEIIQVIRIIQLIQGNQVRLAHLWVDFRLISDYSKLGWVLSLEEFAGAVVTSVPLPLSADPVPFLWTKCQNESLLGAEFWSFRICPSWYLGENSAVTLSVLSLRSSNLSFSTLSNFHQLRKKIWLRPKKNRCIKDRKKWNECASGIRVVTLVLLSPIERSRPGQET